MSLMHIRAQFQCDGCGRGFIVEMDPGTSIPPDWTLFDEAVDCVRGGNVLRFVDQKRDEPAGGIFCTVQADQHLCPGCTFKVDEFVTEDRNATADEIKKALAQNTLHNAVNPDEIDDDV